MHFLGIEHGTRGVRSSLIPDSSTPGSYEPESSLFFEIKRDHTGSESCFPSFIEELDKRIDISDILLGVMTYSMGDAFTEITNIGELENRGILSMEGAGTITGLGSSIFDELNASEIPMMAVPGIHRYTPSLLPSFRHLYSHCSAPDKVCAAYQASLFLRSIGLPGRDLILCDVGANTVTLLIRQGMIIGGIDAAMGAPGLIQGPIDLEGIRSIDEGSSSANGMFSNAGLFQNLDPDSIQKDPDLTSKYEALVHAVAMEINGLRTFLQEPEAIIFAGSAPTLAPGMFQDMIGSLFNGTSIHYLNSQCGALGSASMARDIHHGAREILGIKIRVY